MKRKQLRKIFILVVVLVFTGSGIALAHDDWGRGGNRDDDGGHMMDYDGAYGSAGHNLSRSEYRRLENAREKYYNETRELQEKMDDKRYAIRREMNKENPDRRKIKSLQKELSALRAQFDRYALDYDLAVRKALPDSARDSAYASGHRGGYGG